jgi:hypothetical protein
LLQDSEATQLTTTREWENLQETVVKALPDWSVTSTKNATVSGDIFSSHSTRSDLQGDGTTKHRVKRRNPVNLG